MSFMSSILSATFACFLPLLALAQKSPEVISKEAFTIGETIQFQSDILGELRHLNVYIPLGYNEQEKKDYPVIYLLDGSMDEDVIHISGLVQFCSFSWINVVEESIVVGISNVDRKRDFTFPTTIEEDKKTFPTTGGSVKFIQFLQEELVPFVENNYRVSSQSTLIGQSLGGLLATQILLKSPELFDTYFIVSPSLWWDDFSLLKEGTSRISEPKKIFVAVGEEGPEMEAGAMELIAMLQRLRNRENEKTFLLEYAFLSQFNHGDILHAAVYEGFLRFSKSEEE